MLFSRTCAVLSRISFRVFRSWCLIMLEVYLYIPHFSCMHLTQWDNHFSLSLLATDPSVPLSRPWAASGARVTPSSVWPSTGTASTPRSPCWGAMTRAASSALSRQAPLQRKLAFGRDTRSCWWAWNQAAFGDLPTHLCCPCHPHEHKFNRASAKFLFTYFSLHCQCSQTIFLLKCLQEGKKSTLPPPIYPALLTPREPWDCPSAAVLLTASIPNLREKELYNWDIIYILITKCLHCLIRKRSWHFKKMV